MSYHIFSLIKIFKNKSFLDGFLDGNLYMNRISYFRNNKNYPNDDKYDVNEGLVGWFQPEKMKVIIAGHEIPSSDIIEPIKAENKIISNTPIFCLYSINNRDFGDINENNIQEFQKHMILDNKVHSLGEYCVIVARTKPFLDRFHEASRNQNLKTIYKLVKYYDPKIFHGSFNSYDSIFMKQYNYLHQNEFRIAIVSEIKGNDAYIFKIGNIRDICHVCETKDINNLIKLEWK